MGLIRDTPDVELEEDGVDGADETVEWSQTNGWNGSVMIMMVRLMM
jgi:hypothetical protein